MNDFTFYFKMGWSHIISKDALDHLLFIAALSAPFTIRQWRPILLLVTSFTIGHSITLVLSSTDVIRFDTSWTEFLIPVTIVIAGLIAYQASPKQNNYSYRALLAVFFGLIHGMGFAGSIRFMLASSQKIAVPLLGFNLGLEAGQVLVLMVILLMAAGLLKMGIRASYFTKGIAFLAIIAGLAMCISRYPL